MCIFANVRLMAYRNIVIIHDTSAWRCNIWKCVKPKSYEYIWMCIELCMYYMVAATAASLTKMATTTTTTQTSRNNDDENIVVRIFQFSQNKNLWTVCIPYYVGFRVHRRRWSCTLFFALISYTIHFSFVLPPSRFWFCIFSFGKCLSL